MVSTITIILMKYIMKLLQKYRYRTMDCITLFIIIMKLLVFIVFKIT